MCWYWPYLQCLVLNNFSMASGIPCDYPNLIINANVIIKSMLLICIMWPDMRKPTMYAQVKCTLLLHIIDTFIYYSKHSDKITRGGQVCFSTRIFLDHTNHWKASTDSEGSLGDFNSMAWTQIVSYTLALTSVVVCDWCGALFGIWLQLGVPLSVFILTEDLSPLSHPHHLPPTHYKHHSWYYSRVSKSLPKSSRTNYQRWLGHSTWGKKILYFQCKPHASTANYSQVIT